MKQSSFLAEPEKVRKKRRVMMKAITGDRATDNRFHITFECRKCDFQGSFSNPNESEFREAFKKGLPCPICNKEVEYSNSEKNGD